jgi:hypothetical protein
MIDPKVKELSRIMALAGEEAAPAPRKVEATGNPNSNFLARLVGGVAWLGRQALKEVQDHPAETVAAAAASGVMLAIAFAPRRRGKNGSGSVVETGSPARPLQRA